MLSKDLFVVEFNRVYFLRFCTKYDTWFSKYRIELIVDLSSTNATKNVCKAFFPGFVVTNTGYSSLWKHKMIDCGLQYLWLLLFEAIVEPMVSSETGMNPVSMFLKKKWDEDRIYDRLFSKAWLVKGWIDILEYVWERHDHRVWVTIFISNAALNRQEKSKESHI